VSFYLTTGDSSGLARPFVVTVDDGALPRSSYRCDGHTGDIVAQNAVTILQVE